MECHMWKSVSDLALHYDCIMQIAVLRSWQIATLQMLCFLAFLPWLDLLWIHASLALQHPYPHLMWHGGEEKTPNAPLCNTKLSKFLSTCHIEQKKTQGGINGPVWWKLVLDTAPVSVLRWFLLQKKHMLKQKSHGNGWFFADFPDWNNRVNSTRRTFSKLFSGVNPSRFQDWQLPFFTRRRYFPHFLSSKFDANTLED